LYALIIPDEWRNFKWSRQKIHSHYRGQLRDRVRTAKAFAGRGKNLVIAARRTENLEALKREIAEQHPSLDVVIRTVDLSVLENVYQFYSSLKNFRLETWVNNAGFGNYDSVAQQV
jgi:short-subunit dehydrogenase